MNVHAYYVLLYEYVGTRKDMEALEKRYLDGDYTPFCEVAEPSPPTKRSASPGMKEFGV